MIVLFRIYNEQKRGVFIRLGLVVSFSQPVINTQVILWSQLIFGAESLACCSCLRANSVFR